MRKTKAFVIVKELCSDAFFLANAGPQELYIHAAFECIDTVISILNYTMVKKNAEEQRKAEDIKIAEEAETYRIRLKQETEKMRREFEAAEHALDWQMKRSCAVMKTVRGLVRELRETAEFVQRLKKELSKTEEDVRKNQPHIAALDDWLIKSAKHCKDLLEYYQIGDEEDG